MLPTDLSNGTRENRAPIRVIYPPHFTPLNEMIIPRLTSRRKTKNHDFRIFLHGHRRFGITLNPFATMCCEPRARDSRLGGGVCRTGRRVEPASDMPKLDHETPSDGPIRDFPDAAARRAVPPDAKHRLCPAGPAPNIAKQCPLLLQALRGRPAAPRVRSGPCSAKGIGPCKIRPHFSANGLSVASKLHKLTNPVDDWFRTKMMIPPFIRDFYR